jgi:hypothetical protein
MTRLIYIFYRRPFLKIEKRKVMEKFNHKFSSRLGATMLSPMVIFLAFTLNLYGKDTPAPEQPSYQLSKVDTKDDLSDGNPFNDSMRNRCRLYIFTVQTLLNARLCLCV